MDITRAELESVLVARRGPMLVAAGMATTYIGSNPNLNDPLGYAIRYLGGTVASIATVVDADFSTLPDSATVDGVLDVAELRLLRSLKGHLDEVDSRVGPLSVSLSQLARSVQEDIEELSKLVLRKYGVGSTMVEVGLLTLNFADHNDPLPDEIDAP